jgi:hypothetical protein
MLFLSNLNANLTYFGGKFLSGTVFCARHTTPIHEKLVKAKVSLLNVVKNFKFGAKIALTNISLSFITHLLSNKQTQVQLYPIRYHHLPSPYT